jgi:hypothetical protein
MNDAGELLIDEYERCSMRRRSSSAFTHVSNALAPSIPSKR